MWGGAEGQRAIGQGVQNEIYVIDDPSADLDLINNLFTDYSIVWVESTKTDDPENTVYIMLTEDYDAQADVAEFLNQGKKVYLLPEGYIPPIDAEVTDLSISPDETPEIDPPHIPPKANHPNDSIDPTPEMGFFYKGFDFFRKLLGANFLTDSAAAALVCNNHEVVGGVKEPGTGSVNFPVDKSNEYAGYFRALDTTSLPTGSPPWRYYYVTSTVAPGNVEFVSDYGRTSSTNKWANFWAFDWSGSGGQVCVSQGTKLISSFGSCYRTNIAGVPYFWYRVGSWHTSWPHSLPWCSNYPNANGVLIWNFCTSQYETFYFKEFNRATTYSAHRLVYFGELVGNENNYNCPSINSNAVYFFKREFKNCSTCSKQNQNTRKSLGYGCRHDVTVTSRYSYIIELTSDCSTVENCKYQNVKCRDPAGTDHCP